MFDKTSVKIQRVGTTDEEVTYSVSADDHILGSVTFATYYEPMIKGLDRYAAIWAGPTLCVIDRQLASVQCFERRDETHRVHPFNKVWIIEGELSVELFEPSTLEVTARYAHDEVITDSWLDGELICIRDFQNRTICLRPSESLGPVASTS